MSYKHNQSSCDTYKDFNVGLKVGNHKETIRDKKENKGFSIQYNNGTFTLRLHNSYMGEYQTPQACQQVIDKHHRRDVMRAIEIKEEMKDRYYDDL
jgi:hypothetical protein